MPNAEVTGAYPEAKFTYAGSAEVHSAVGNINTKQIPACAWNGLIPEALVELVKSMLLKKDRGKAARLIGEMHVILAGILWFECGYLCDLIPRGHAFIFTLAKFIWSPLR